MSTTYPNNQDRHLKGYRGALFIILLLENAAIVVEWCSDSSRLGENVLVSLHNLIRDAIFVFHEALGCEEGRRHRTTL